MTPTDADSFADHRAAYIHIPFCRSICPYCDFAVVAGREDEVDRYIAALITEIKGVEPGPPLDSVYFGGGTPSHIASEKLGAVLHAIESHHGFSADLELSIEVNPEDMQAGKAGELFALGFNRISFGAQSFEPAVLAALGRNHTPAQIESAVDNARSFGFANVSLDVIFGDPCEDDSSWERTLLHCVGLEPDHVSAYALTVEPGTTLWREIRDGAPGPEDDTQADRYERAGEVFENAGLRRYEVSNWATPGAQCRYNLTVWAQGEYLGHGTGAHGYADGVRYRNHRSLDAYLRRVEQGDSPVAAREQMDPWQREVDRVFVGLRRGVGVRLGPAGERFVQSRDGLDLAANRVLEVVDGRIRVTNPLLTDAVQRSLMATARR